MKLMMRRIVVILSALCLAAGVLTIGAWATGFFQTPPNQIPAAALPPPPQGVPVLNNDASAGYVTFTFDDGPSTRTTALLSELKAEHVQAVFFVIGDKAAGNPSIIRAESENGFVIGNHTWDHLSLTGQDGPTKNVMTNAQVKSELTKTDNAITAAGLPRPTLWRAPYDDVNQRQAAVASSLGLRLVMSYGAPGGNIVDSQDWNDGLSPQAIASYIEHGYVSNDNGDIKAPTADQLAHAASHNGDAGGGWTYNPGVQAGSILSFHDGLQNTPNTIKAIPLIVAYLNAHHLGATDVVRPNALGRVDLTQNNSSGG